MSKFRVGDRVRATDIPFESGVVVQIFPIMNSVDKLCIFLDSERLIYGYEDEFELEGVDTSNSEGCVEIEYYDILEE
jgi:hypothetical protein